MVDMTEHKLTSNSVTAAAPSSTANLGPGFDIFGLAVDAFDDYVTIKRSPTQNPDHGNISLQNPIDIDDEPSSQIRIEMIGQYHESIPVEVRRNSAGLALQKVIKEFDIRESFFVIVNKNIPPGFGMGSSAASAAAAVMAIDTLLDLHIPKSDLVRFAAEGEKASAGALHYDNVAASILGGFVLIRPFPKIPEFIHITPPKNLRLVFAIPKLNVPAKKTELARKVLPEKVLLGHVIRTLSNASTIVAGFFSKDVNMIARGVEDIIVEPARKHLIPCFDSVRANALAAGALAVTISGAGPSMVAITSDEDQLEEIANSMRNGFKQCELTCTTVKCSPSQGARIVSKE
jgi:homoserine kinase